MTRHEPSRGLRQRLPVLAILLLSGFVHFWRLDGEGYGNLYYAAAVRSMLADARAFFFASFDSGGFVSVDKPPLGLWVQAASASLFGFRGWSLIWPQGVAGVLSVAVLYRLVGRTFGRTAGTIAALFLALTPISVAANRNNTMDGLLVLTSLLAAWAVLRASERGRLRWFLLCAAWVGIGFNIKMLQAFLPLPAFYLLYLLAGPRPTHPGLISNVLRFLGGRLAHLALASVVLAVISLSWATAVDLTPASERPFVGSSRNNTVGELILGHNGMARLGALGRFIGIRWGPGPAPAHQASPPPGQPGPTGTPGAGRPGGPPLPPLPPASPGAGPQAGSGPPRPPSTAPPAPAAGGPNNEIGSPGPWRLFNAQLAGQASWLLPIVPLCLLAAAWRERLRWPLGPQHGALLLWSAWLAPQLVFFSFAGLFHRYYLEMLAPAVAALAGAGLAAMWGDFPRPGLRGWLLPTTLLAGATGQVLILRHFPEWSRRLVPWVLGVSGVAAATLIIGRLVTWRSGRGPGTEKGWQQAAQMASLVLGLAGLLIGPAAWTAMPVWGKGDASLPFAGPELLTRKAPQGGSGLPDVSRLAAYLTAQHQSERFLAAAPSAQTAAPLILATGQPVMALGGFSGNDRILSVDALAARVARGEVRFFVLPASPTPAGAPPQGVNGDLLRWVVQRCRPVPPDQWQGPRRAPGGAPAPAGIGELFDCLAHR